MDVGRWTACPSSAFRTRFVSPHGIATPPPLPVGATVRRRARSASRCDKRRAPPASCPETPASQGATSPKPHVSASLTTPRRLTPEFRQSFAQAGYVFLPLDDDEAGSAQRAAHGLQPPAQVLRQKRLGDGGEGQCILRPREALALVRIQHVRHRDASLDRKSTRANSSHVIITYSDAR